MFCAIIKIRYMQKCSKGGAVLEIVIIMLTGFILYLTEGELYRRFWHKGLEAQISITPDTTFGGDKSVLEITLLNKKLIPLPWLWVKMHISSALKFDGAEKPKGDHVYYNALFCIMGWQKIQRRLTFTAGKRGYYPLRSFDVVGTSILFNGKHSKSFDTHCALTVYPKLAALESIDETLMQLDGIASSRGFINPDPFEFAGIREYMPNDSLRDINFKASARMGELMTNTHNPTVKGRIEIVLCMKLLKQRYEEERFEYSISLAAALAEHYISDGYSVMLRSNGLDGAYGTVTDTGEGIGSGHLKEIFEGLARTDYEHTEVPEILMPNSFEDCITVFISPTVDYPIITLFNALRENRSYIKWFFPVMQFDMAVSTPPADDAELVPVPADILKY